MEDIGMHPDTQSGVSESVECHICHRTGPDALAEYCSECMNPAGPDCCEDYHGEIVCDECAQDRGYW